MRIIAIDLGERRIGVAAADDGTRVAVPLDTVEASADPVEDVARIVEQQSADKLILGLPLSLNGSLGPQGQRVKAFAEALAARLSIPVQTWDERLTTVEAERRLGPGSGRRQRPDGRASARDALAAAIILQAYLDSLPKTDPGP